IWLTWRQFRTQTWVVLAALLAAAVGLTLTGRTLAQLYTDSGVASCPTGGNCESQIQNFTNSAEQGATGFAYLISAITMYLLPLLIGIFWGAPLVAREFETGTFRLAWNQSVSRSRWLGSKIALLGAASMATAGLLSLVVTWAF